MADDLTDAALYAALSEQIYRRDETQRISPIPAGWARASSHGALCQC
jgi:hypothetical protein